jgi:hypothetical protein
MRREMEEELEGDDNEEDGWDGKEGRGRVSVDPGWAVIGEFHFGDDLIKGIDRYGGGSDR